MPENVKADRLEAIDREIDHMIVRIVDARCSQRIDQEAIAAIESLSSQRVELTRPHLSAIAA